MGRGFCYKLPGGMQLLGMESGQGIAVNITRLAESFQGAVMALSGQDLCFTSQ